MQNPGITELHYQCPNGSGALIFPPSSATKLAESNEALKDKLEKQALLLKAVLDVLPKASREKIPADLLKGLSDDA